MKKLLLILLCLPFIGFGQKYKVIHHHDANINEQVRGIIGWDEKCELLAFRNLFWSNNGVLTYDVITIVNLINNETVDYILQDPEIASWSYDVEVVDSFLSKYNIIQAKTTKKDWLIDYLSYSDIKSCLDPIIKIIKKHDNFIFEENNISIFFERFFTTDYKVLLDFRALYEKFDPFVGYDESLGGISFRIKHYCYEIPDFENKLLFVIEGKKRLGDYGTCQEESCKYEYFYYYYSCDKINNKLK